MHDGADRRQLAIWQYGTSLIVMNGDDYSSKERRPRIVGRDVLSPQRTSYFTITSGEHGTLLYVDGMFAAGNSNWKLAMPVEGGDQLRLVLGHSVYGKYAWMGDLHGLAISGKALSEDAVMRRFERWAKDRNFDFLKQESTMLLFTFADTNGDSFVDESGRNLTLVLPEHMTVLKKTFLSPPWRHLNWSHVASVDAVVNVVGFIPLGVVLYGFLQGFSGQFNKHKGLLAVIVCMFLSLGIELSQAWIPTRYSTQLDLILNTFGAWLGIVGWKLIHRVKEKRINPV
jgi:VanZ family protein